MQPFSATDAAFAGFRIIRDRPIIVVMWTLVSIGLALLFLLLAFLLMGGAFLDMARLGEGAQPSPDEVMRLMLGMVPLLLLMAPAGLLYISVLINGVNRAVLRPQEKSFYYLRLGADELRLAVVLIVQGLGWLGLYLAAALVVGATVGVGALTSGQGANAAAMVGLVILFILAAPVVVAFLAVKFSLAGAQTFHSRSINIFGSWALTRGRFWPILGAFLLMLVLAFMISMAQFAVQLLFQALALTGDVTMMVIGIGLSTLISSVIGTVIHVVFYAPAPTIYKAIAVIHEDQSAVFE